MPARCSIVNRDFIASALGGIDINMFLFQPLAPPNRLRASAGTRRGTLQMLAPASRSINLIVRFLV